MNSFAASVQRTGWAPSLRYPDPAVVALHPSFLKYRLFSASVEMLASGFRWMEGPVWFGDGRYLLASDVASNRIIRWDEVTGTAAVFRDGANHANGNTRDLQGRLITCEGSGRRITRTEHDGRIVVVADNYQGKLFNSPNDVICQSSGAIWFTDPPFQLSNNYEGRIAQQELPHAVYRIEPNGREVVQVIDDLAGPNGLCFSPDERTLYVVESRAQPSRKVWAYSMGADGMPSSRSLHIDAQGPGAFDGIKCDVDGNIWAGWGSDGSVGADAETLDGVMCFDPGGRAIGHIRLPERCANLCFGGIERNRLFMASSHSIYALFVSTRGA